MSKINFNGKDYEIPSPDDFVDKVSVEDVGGIKTFLEQIGIKNVDGTTDFIKHINNNFLISTSAGTSLMNIDEGLSKAYFFNKEIAFKEDVGGGNDWVAVYDMTSDDADINWGYTAGLQSSIGAVSNSIDFTNYDFVRVHWRKGTYDTYKDFDISGIKAITSYIPYFTMAHFDSAILVLSGIAIGFKYDETTGQRGLYVGRGRSWNFKTDGTISQTDLSSDTNVHIFKIEVK